MIVTEKHFLLIFIIFRLITVFLVQTSFVADEFWQSTEVAHNFSFGYGYLTWEWSKEIRSCCYPFLFYILYNLMPDSSFSSIYGPKIAQAVLSALGDYFSVKVASDLFGRNCGLWVALNALSSWFLFYCSSRTLSNMAEASLTACGFYFYPWKKTRDNSIGSLSYLWFAGASILIRPTAIVTWLPLYLWHFFKEAKYSKQIWNTCIVGFAVAMIMILVDRWCFGHWVITPYNFFLFNWSRDIGAFYGSHPFVWYYFIGLPIVLGFQFFYFILGLFLPELRKFYILIGFILFVLSFPSHKEFRFLLPIMHISMIISGVVLNKIQSGRMNICNTKIPKIFSIGLPVITLVIHVPLVLYMSLWHQRGVVEATHFLSANVDAKSSVLFLMPCHSTPYYSYIHKNISMRFLTCEPNFEEDESYVEEAEKFFASSLQWLSENYDMDSSFPSHIVMYDYLYDKILEFLKGHEYKLCFSSFHTHFPQGRIGKYVHIYCKF